MIHRACIIVMEARPRPKLPPVLAELDESEASFLYRHVVALRKRAESPDGQQARFRDGSPTRSQLRRVIRGNEEQFLRTSETLVRQLQGTMAIATNPRQGLFVVVSSRSEDVEDGSGANTASLLKLDANVEVAQWRRLTEGGARLSVLQNCLPGPGGLQKGISWPDPRPTSDVIIEDRSLQNALYFLNAFDIDVSRRASDVEKALQAQISKLPAPEMKRALVVAAEKAGRADQVARELKQEFPSLDVDIPELGAGGVPGVIRPNKLAARPTTLAGGGIKIVVPIDKVDAVSEPQRVGAHWEVTVRFPVRPTWRP